MGQVLEGNSNESSVDFKTKMAQKDAERNRKIQEKKDQAILEKKKYDDHLAVKVSANPEKYVDRLVRLVRNKFASYSKQRQLLFCFTDTDPWNDHCNGYSVQGAGDGHFRITVNDYDLLKKMKSPSFQPVITEATKLLAQDGITFASYKNHLDDYLAYRS